MTYDVEVIRYDSKGKKTIEHDFIEATQYTKDDHNNLTFLYHGMFVKEYHGYNWISIKPYTEE